MFGFIKTSEHVDDKRLIIKYAPKHELKRIKNILAYLVCVVQWQVVIYNINIKLQAGNGFDIFTNQ